MQASADGCQVLPCFIKGGLLILRGDNLDRIRITAARKGRKIADIDAGTYDRINGKWRNVARVSGYASVGADYRIAVAVGAASRYKHRLIGGD